MSNSKTPLGYPAQNGARETSSDELVGANALIHYRGALPHVSPTTAQLDLNLAGMLTGGRGAIPDGLPPIGSEPHVVAVSVRYRPCVTFQKTL